MERRSADRDGDGCAARLDARADRRRDRQVSPGNRVDPRLRPLTNCSRDGGSRNEARSCSSHPCSVQSSTCRIHRWREPHRNNPGERTAEARPSVPPALRKLRALSHVRAGSARPIVRRLPGSWFPAVRRAPELRAPAGCAGCCTSPCAPRSACRTRHRCAPAAGGRHSGKRAFSEMTCFLRRGNLPEGLQNPKKVTGRRIIRRVAGEGSGR